MLSVSIVSHGQLGLVQRLLQSLEENKPRLPLEILITENRDHARRTFDHGMELNVHYVANPRPRALSVNTNAAFRVATGEYFCIMNPDVVFRENVFDALISRVAEGPLAIVAPLVVDENGRVQDSARRLPTPWDLLTRRITPRRLAAGQAARLPDDPDWLAAILLVMPAALFRRLGGMDERYYLYFEDVDFCTRARLAGVRLRLVRDVRIVHHARRRSRRNPVYTAIHLASAVRFFASPVYRQARSLRR
jgi:hypothetical protein